MLQHVDDPCSIPCTRRSRWTLRLLLLLMLALVGCAAPSQWVQRIPPPTPTSAPTTLALAPTSTPVATPVPTATPRPTSISTATSTALPSPIEPTATALVPLATPTFTAFDEAQRIMLFDQVCELIEQHYLYTDFGGVDWAAIKQTYRAQALAAPGSTEFYAALTAMVDQLNDQHSRFENPQKAFVQQALASGTDAYVGVGVLTAFTAEGLLVTTVFPNSPAAEAGIKRRDMIVTVDGTAVDPFDTGISGPAGSVVELQIRDPSATVRTVMVQRRAVLAQYLPEAYLLPDTQIGYVLIQSFWAQDMAEKTEDVLGQLLADSPELDGLIIDLRGNGGGWRNVLEGLLGNFVVGDVGVFYNQNSTYPLTITPNALHDRLSHVPLVVLVDGDTRSYAEVFTAILRDARSAQVIGVNTPGNTETIFAYDLDDGSRLWIAQEGFKLPDGADLEGHGVVPDQAMGADWATFSEQRDPHIMRAIEVIDHSMAGTN